MSAAENSVRADLEAAIKQHEAPEVETVETPVAPAVEAKPETPAQERARDELGRFAAKGSDAAGASKPSVQSTTEQGKLDTERGNGAVRAQPAGVEQPLEGKEAAPAALAPPNGWSAEAKAIWHTLPKEVQEAAVQREKDVAKFTSTRDEHASFGKEIYQAVQPYLATIKAEGGTPVTAVQSLLNTAYVLRTGSPEQKKQLLLQTAKEFGVDLSAPSPAAQPNGAGHQLTPQLAALQNEVQQLRGFLTQGQQAEQQRIQAEVSTEIQAFAADPKHTHFETVKGHMSALIASGAAKDLQDAYDQAVWARPDTRATLLAQQRAEEEQKRTSEARAKAEAARKRAVSVTGGPGNTAAASTPASRGSVREDLMAALEASSGAV